MFDLASSDRVTVISVLAHGLSGMVQSYCGAKALADVI